MGYRTDNYGRGQALENDKTTTGARCIASINDSEFGRRIVRVGDVTTPCPKCGKRGRIVDGEPRVTFFDVAVAVHGSVVHCDCPPGTNRVIAPAGQWLGRGRDPVDVAREEHAAKLAAQKEADEKRREEERERSRVFAKSCLRGEGCNDAGDQREPHTNFAEMAFFQAMPADEPEADPVTDTEAPQRAQTAKKKKAATAPEDIPKPKKRSALYKWWFGNHEEMDYQIAVAAAASAQRAQTATAGANVLRPVAGYIRVGGTWAVRASGVATAGVGAPLAGLLVGMMPGRLNDGEQDFIDKMRAEQMREAPTRVRFTWESDANGNPIPHGWHTPPGQDMVRVRKMEWDSTYKAYTFTTEEDPRITIIWTPDASGDKQPWNTGNQSPPRLPGTVIVDPLQNDSSVRSTTSPAPEEKSFADYILILPVANIPPIYIYLRHNPGQVTGKGQRVSGIWLSDASTGNGSPVPSQIADRLRGRTFTSFDKFREAFWQEVANDPELSEQFAPGNIARMKYGMAPRARTVDTIGKRRSFEIHHIKPVSQGGEVYNVDNMGVSTPKRHIDIHRGA
ncbi:pyocin [Enterobacter bugandensis]|uniref:S-type pyocin domain-containing protein n=1 Tax=Enterobacter bugandensis TaxID=881260 RepID=UPI0012996A51|nr:S-type pyocin domain-containing protein [Enterobacter bugandensis]MRE93315.1 pyocin [Enterobacter bugandensis]